MRWLPSNQGRTTALDAGGITVIDPAHHERVIQPGAPGLAVRSVRGRERADEHDEDGDEDGNNKTTLEELDDRHQQLFEGIERSRCCMS